MLHNFFGMKFFGMKFFGPKSTSLKGVERILWISMLFKGFSFRKIVGFCGNYWRVVICLKNSQWEFNDVLINGRILLKLAFFLVFCWIMKWYLWFTDRFFKMKFDYIWYFPTNQLELILCRWEIWNYLTNVWPG